MQYDGGEDSKGVTPPIGWLMDYWMGRYYGFILPPRDESDADTTKAPRHARATPYAGPPRPVARWEINAQ
jgi:hypothetical protein